MRLPEINVLKKNFMRHTTNKFIILVLMIKIEPYGFLENAVIVILP